MNKKNNVKNFLKNICPPPQKESIKNYALI